MALAALLGPEPAELAAIGEGTPAVRPDRVALVGVRSLDQQEKDLVRASGVHVFTMSDIDRAGLAGSPVGPWRSSSGATPICTSRSISMSATRGLRLVWAPPCVEG
jgi:hypothetical protein